MHVLELCKIDADNIVQGNKFFVRSGKILKVTDVMESEFRASVSLILAGHSSDSEIALHRIYHLDRSVSKV